MQMMLWPLALALCSVTVYGGDTKGRVSVVRMKPADKSMVVNKTERAVNKTERAVNKTERFPVFSYENILDAAITLIKAAKKTRAMDRSFGNDRIDDLPDDIADNELVSPRCPPKPMDCQELQVSCDISVSGVYRIYPRSRVETWGDGGFEVYCDMDTDGGGWTVIQQRDDFGASPDFFFKDWESYKRGFGDLKYDYWIGNDKIFALSNQRPTLLRFDLMDFEGGKSFATYNNFYIDDESQAYRLHLGDYRGNAGDSFSAHNLCKFTTKDRDNDNNRQNCALLYKGGWWYNDCHTVNVNGLYLKGAHSTYADGINWYLYKGFHYSLKRTVMKVREANFARIFNLEVATQNAAG